MLFYSNGQTSVTLPRSAFTSSGFHTNWRFTFSGFVPHAPHWFETFRKLSLTFMAAPSRRSSNTSLLPCLLRSPISFHPCILFCQQQPFQCDNWRVFNYQLLKYDTPTSQIIVWYGRNHGCEEDSSQPWISPQTWHLIISASHNKTFRLFTCWQWLLQMKLYCIHGNKTSKFSVVATCSPSQPNLLQNPTLSHVSANLDGPYHQNQRTEASSS